MKQNDTSEFAALIKKTRTDALAAFEAQNTPINCPQCSGAGILLAAFQPIQVTCDMCNGSGNVTAITIQWKAQGANMKSQRMVKRMKLKDAAKYHGITVAELSKMERGCIAPQPLKY